MGYKIIGSFAAIAVVTTLASVVGQNLALRKIEYDTLPTHHRISDVLWRCAAIQAETLEYLVEGRPGSLAQLQEMAAYLAPTGPWPRHSTWRWTSSSRRAPGWWRANARSRPPWPR